MTKGIKMSTWKKVKLSDIGEIVGGATPPTSREEYYNGDIPWLTPKDLAGYHERYICRGERNITKEGLDACSAKIMPQGTVLFSSRAPIGYVAIAKNDICTNQGFKSIIPNSNIDSLFLYYLLVYNKNTIEAFGSGTTFKEVSAETMRNIEVRIPDFQTQKAISAILNSLDTKIEINHNLKHNLQNQMTTIFRQARSRSSWKSRKLGDILIFYDNLRKPLSSVQREKMKHIYPYYGATSIVDYVDDYLCEGLYILISEDGANVVDSLGQPLIQYTYGKFWVNNHAHVVKGRQNYSEALIYAMLGSLNMQSIVTGAAQPKINQANLRNFEVAVPEFEEAKSLSDILTPLLQQMILHDQENERLSKIRDALLLRLMSGTFDASQ